MLSLSSLQWLVGDELSGPNMNQNQRTSWSSSDHHLVGAPNPPSFVEGFRLQRIKKVNVENKLLYVFKVTPTPMSCGAVFRCIYQDISGYMTQSSDICRGFNLHIAHNNFDDVSRRSRDREVV